jgi:hypothetical protein
MSTKVGTPLCETAFHGDAPATAVVYMRMTIPRSLPGDIEGAEEGTAGQRMTPRWFGACLICRDQLRQRAQLAGDVEEDLAGLAFEERPVANVN